MNKDIAISLITAFTSILSAAIAGYVAYKIAGIHKQLNSMRTEENQTNKDLGHAEGKAEEKQKQADKTN